jgi:PAS domain S-box-containing protein
VERVHDPHPAIPFTVEAYDGLPDLFWAIDPDAHVAYVNRAWEAVLGYGAGDLVGRTPMDIVHPADLADALRHGAAWQAAGTLQGFECRMRHADGSYRTIMWSAWEREMWTAAVGKDVTARAVELDGLTQDLDRLRESHAVGRVVSWEWDPETDLILEFSSVPPELKAQPGGSGTLSERARAVPEPDRSVLLGAIGEVLADGADRVVRVPFGLAQGGQVQLECAMRRVEADGGLRVRGTTRDVSAEHAAASDAAGMRGFWQAIVDSLPEELAVLNGEGMIVGCNQAWAAARRANGDRGLGVGVGWNYLRVCAAALDEPIGSKVAGALGDILAGRRESLMTEFQSGDGAHHRWSRIRARRFAGGGSRVVVTHEDITDERRSDHALRLQSRVVDEVDAAVVMLDPRGRVLQWSRGAERLLGWAAEVAIGREWVELRGGSPAAVAALNSVMQDGGCEADVDVVRGDGSQARLYIRGVRVDDPGGEAVGVALVAVDLTRRGETERQLRGARNFLRTVTQSLGEGLYTLDAEGRVTSINPAGEQMLGWRAAELVGQVMHLAVHSRHADGSDHPIEDCPITRSRKLSEPVRVEDDVFLRRDGSMMPVAYTATPFVTEAGQRGWAVIFSDITERKERERRLLRQLDEIQISEDVLAALAEDRMVLYAQPIVDIATEKVVQHELLIRMIDREGNVVSPGVFLPAAEQSGMIRHIDRWVVGQAVGLAARGHAVELNLSGVSLSDPQLFAEIAAEIQLHCVNPALLCFELTETTLMTDEQSACEFIEKISALGASVALDDFGTGYSGFSYLKRLPVDQLKIDIEFVRDIRTEPASLHVVEAVAHLARSFGHRTVAEGVEDRETLDLLRKLGIDYAQGYLLGRPIPAEEAFTHE